jgi:hypothetical protein
MMVNDGMLCAPSPRVRQRANKKAGIAPGLLFLFAWIVRSSRTMTVSSPQFEARFGGEAGHDLISVS